jgi:hypothetical protein
MFRRAAMADDDKRVTIEEATKLYPDEWIVFIKPRIDTTNTELIDGVVYHHGKDRDVALDTSREIDGDAAVYFTGKPRYRTVTLSTDAECKSGSESA